MITVVRMVLASGHSDGTRIVILLSLPSSVFFHPFSLFLYIYASETCVFSVSEMSSGSPEGSQNHRLINTYFFLNEVAHWKFLKKMYFRIKTNTK